VKKGLLPQNLYFGKMSASYTFGYDAADFC